MWLFWIIGVSRMIVVLLISVLIGENNTEALFGCIIWIILIAAGIILTTLISKRIH